MGCDRKPCGNQQGDNKIHAHGHLPSCGTTGYGTGGRHRGVRRHRTVGYQCQERDGRIRVPANWDGRPRSCHTPFPCDGRLLGRTWRTSREPPSQEEFIRVALTPAFRRVVALDRVAANRDHRLKTSTSPELTAVENSCSHAESLNCFGRLGNHPNEARPLGYCKGG
jgi:hypothetical protein